ncbi:MAG TPA: terminase family protein [Bryobacteraceae bacterium]|nr:terminase family protein [Bryobacteraceae bacterium]
MDRAGEDGIRKIEYQALPSQQKFHDSKARFKGFSGPIGSGKSAALCHEAIKLAYVNPGRTGLIGAPTYPMLRDATVMALVEILEKNKVPHEMNRADNYLVLRETRSRILFRAVEEFERLRGSNLAWFGLDELTYTQEEAWLRLEGRLRDPKAARLCGFAVWTPKGYDWVYERFIASPVEGYETVQAKAFENRFLLERIPDYYERLKNSYDARFYQQEALGEYLDMHAGRVYYAFDRKENVVEAQVNPALPLLWALDFNVNPMCSVVAQASGDAVTVLDEIVLPRASTMEACEEFAGRFPSHGRGLAIYADATGARLQTSGTTDLRMLKEFFASGEYGEVQFKVPKSNPAVRERVALMNAKLESAAGRRMLRVDARCRELIKDLEQVSYKESSLLIDKDRDPKRTHLSDALGYLMWQECRGVEKVGERGLRLI